MKTEINIVGMTCQHCVNNVTNTLNNLAGVTSTEVKLEQKLALVESSAALDEAVIADAIKDAGYSVLGIKSV